MKLGNKFSVLTYFLCLLAVGLLSACSGTSDFGNADSLPVQANGSNMGDELDFVFARNPDLIKTTKGAAELDLETPLRCDVNWNKQEMITAVPYNMNSFNLIQNGRNDALPKYEISGLSFKSLPAQKALLKLLKAADLHLVAKDAPYARISGENLHGNLTDIVKMMTDAAGIFYSYDAERKVLRVSRRANFTLYVPKSRPIMMGLLDVIRGSGITDIVADWGDYSITFTADFDEKNKIMDLVDYFKSNPVLIAYDVSVFRIYPANEQKYVDWQAALDAFDFSTLNTAQAGVIGRILSTSNDLNISTLKQFLGAQASIVPVAEGRFIVPNLWLSRFDVGKCGVRTAPEEDLSVLAKATLEKGNRIFSNIALDTTQGEIAQFSVRSKLGENLMIIGLPNKIFGIDAPTSETVIFIVPKIIRTAKTNGPIINQI